MSAAAHDWRPDFRYRLDDLFVPGYGPSIGAMERLDDQPYPAGRGVRFAAPAPRAGYTDTVRVCDDMHVLIVDWRATPNSSVRSVWEEVLDPDWGWLYFRLEGEAQSEFNPNDRITLPAPSVSMNVLPLHSTLRWRDDTSVSRRGVSIAFRPGAVTSRLGSLLADCPAPLRRWVTNGTTAYRNVDIPLQPLMNTATRSLFDLPLTGEIRYRFVCSTAEQLMCLALAALARRTGEGTLPMQLAARDRKGLEQVRALLEERLQDPPDTSELARIAGMNRNKLFYGFKYTFGVTISEYVHDLRMQRAHELLASMTVTDVAASVGYAHVSNFTAAFKRHFGRTPSRLHGPHLASTPD